MENGSERQVGVEMSKTSDNAFIAAQIPAHAPGRLRRRPPRTSATQEHFPMPEKEDVLEEEEETGN